MDAAESAAPRAVAVRRGTLVTAVLAYLGLPGLLFAGYLRSPVALLGGALLGVALVAAARARHSPDRSAAPPALVRFTRGEVLAVVALALVLAALAGPLGLVTASSDWHKHNALLHDLATMPWPVTYEGVGGASLVYSFGFYLPAAAAAKVVGGSVLAAHLALFAWMALGYALLLALVGSCFPAGRRAVAAAVVLVTVGGADLLGGLLVPGDPVAPEVWMWNTGVVLEYSGNVTALRWVPQHALPSWFIGTLFVQGWSARQWRDGRALLFAVGLSALWSPFAVIGGVVLLGALLLRLAAQRVALRWRSLWVEVCLGAALLPVAVFLAIPSGGQVLTASGIGPAGLLLFLGLEVALWVVLACLAGRLASALLPVLLLLVVLPLVSLGEFNDLAMRASLPALMALGLLAWLGVLRAWARPGGPNARVAVTVVAATAVALSVPTGVAEVRSAFADPPPDREQRWDESVPAFLERLDSPPSIWAQYLSCPEGAVAGVLGLDACRR
ncbi:hypothetical protein [Geodermatophilus sp. DSM 44513]|uniref:hypothetical protein n=1 Tax=Geodermatophilus sp. DSM 44513 TaxID=1528104 RepID=UPI0014130DC6|nr:hypothetical protein [Geodermatophilus sp. DSM 44513]WNV74803.1 hypothetical protein RTG05_17665 [Geodermatophilus sp. DSM 44513]